MELGYDEIRRIHRMEKNTSKLVEVEQGFYNDLHEFMRAEKADYLDSLKDLSSTKSRDFSNLKKMVEEIFAMREKKIISRALVASRSGETGEEHMASQEKTLFRALVGLLEKHREILSGIFTEKGAQKGEMDLNTLSVEVLSDIPGFVGADMQEYGPYSKGAVIELPLKVAKLLTARKLVAAK